MECYNCGFKLPADAERCPRCGQRFKPRDPAAQPPKSKPSTLNKLKDKLGKKSSGGS